MRRRVRPMTRPAPTSPLSRREVLVLGGMGAATVLLSRCTGLVAPEVDRVLRRG